MPTRSSLPQNGIINAGTVWQDFSGDQTDWSGTHTIDTVNYKEGTQSLKMAVSDSTILDKIISENLKTTKVWGIWVYCYDPSPIVTIELISINFRSVTNFASYFYFDIGGNSLCQGWNYFSVDQSEWSNIGSESWDNTMVRCGIRVKPVAGQTATVSWGGIYKDFSQLPRIVIGFDDADASVVSADCYTYMVNRGLKGTCYVNSSTVGASGKMTAANLDTLYAAGWAMGNHCSVHTDLTSIAPAAASTLITVGRDWLLAQGYTRSYNHLAYPYGYYNTDVLSVCRDAGVLTGRLATGYKFTPSAGRDNLIMPARYVNRTDTLATAQGWIDQACAAGKTIPLIFHKILASPTNVDEWSIANFQSFIDYLVARKYFCVTIDEWYEGLIDPRYMSIAPVRTVVP